ncbi:MAG TPA: cysteine hydrolase [Dongiaceae bacterium]
MSGLAALGADTVHVVVDMQRLFAEETGWRVPTIEAVMPNIQRLVSHCTSRTLYTRFVTPPNAGAANGVWQRFYQRWPQVTTDQLSPKLFDLMAPLAAEAPAEAQIDKEGFSSFSAADFAAALDRLKAGTLVLSGVETDACVLATAIDAIDRGHRVVIARDAVTSFSLEAHRAALDHVLPRFAPLIDLAATTDIIAAWA